MVIVSSEGAPLVRSFSEFEEFRLALMDMAHEDAYVYVFHGQRYLIAGNEDYQFLYDHVRTDYIPLFELPEPSELPKIEDGYIGELVQDSDEGEDEEFEDDIADEDEDDDEEPDGDEEWYSDYG